MSSPSCLSSVREDWVAPRGPKGPGRPGTGLEVTTRVVGGVADEWASEVPSDPEYPSFVTRMKSRPNRRGLRCLSLFLEVPLWTLGSLRPPVRDLSTPP